MKTIFTLVLASFISLFAAAQTRPVNKVTTWYGNWSTPDNWSLKRVPKDGDSIVVEGGRAIFLDKNYNLKNVYIKVIGSGSYIHVKAKLGLDNASILEIGDRARIMAFGADRKNETISIGNVMKFDENANFNVYGYGVASRFTGRSPNGFVTDLNVALPVSFVSFVAVKAEGGILLSWSTASEKDNSHFEIEKSYDGRNWKTLAVHFGNGNTVGLSKYSYKDKETASLVYYRIRQVDIDGTATYTGVRVVKSESATNAKIYSASKNNITVELPANAPATINLTVVNLAGQVIAQRTFANTTGRISLEIANSNGIHVVRIGDMSGWNQTQKVHL